MHMKTVAIINFFSKNINMLQSIKRFIEFEYIIFIYKMSSIMTISRSLKVDLSITPYYHCMTRCVRRTFLCGQDVVTGQDFTHRKGWIVGRIKQLTSIFAIKVCAYAVMSNHYHVVLFINEAQALQWNDEQVLARWKALFPHDASQVQNRDLNEKEVQMKLTLWRERLMSISWYMRCLNEPIARSSNHEDNCTGRFWEGRFKSQALLDEGAVLSAMAYVDLNPIRAKIAHNLEESEFTSIYERIKALAKTTAKQGNCLKQPIGLMAFAKDNHQPKNDNSIIDFKLIDYLNLVDTTGQILREDKRGVIPSNLTPILFRLNLTPRGWIEMVNGLEKGFCHAIGHKDKLRAFGARYSHRAPKGMNSAKKCYLKAS